MEEEEEPKEVKISGNELDSHVVVDSNIKQFDESPHEENVNASSSFEAEHVDERGHLPDQDVDCATTVMGEDQFEQVSLKDQDKNNESEHSNQSPGSDKVHHPYDGYAEDSRYSSGSYSMEYDSSVVGDMHLDNLSNSPGSEGNFGHTNKQFAPSINFDSTGYSSPVKSSPKPRQKKMQSRMYLQNYCILLILLLWGNLKVWIS
jgi:hypothetical protein